MDGFILLVDRMDETLHPPYWPGLIDMERRATHHTNLSDESGLT
jgi:hypothetical protein